MKESWSEKYSAFVERMQEKPSKVKVERFLRHEFPGMEKFRKYFYTSNPVEILTLRCIMSSHGKLE